jgi:hypothetical protein
MAVAYSTSNTTTYTANNSAATINHSPSAMPTHAAGNMLVAIVGQKPDTASAGTAPSGWTLLGAVAGGVGTTGTDTGPVRISIYYKEATSSSEPAPTFALTGQNVSWVVVQVWTKAAGNFWDIAGVGAADTTTGTAFSAATASNPGLTVGDGLAMAICSPTDAQTWSAESVSATGMTTVSMTEIAEISSTASNDIGGVHARGSVVTGTSTAAPTLSATAAGTTTNSAGVAYLVRLREVAPTAKAGTESIALTITEGAADIVQSTLVSKSASDTLSLGCTEFGDSAQVATIITNKLGNPSFETDTSGWSFSGNATGVRTVDAATAPDGAAYATVTSGATTGNITVLSPAENSGTATTHIGGIRARWRTGTPLSMRVDVQYLSSTNAVLDSFNGTAVATNTSTWTTLTSPVASPVPVGTVAVRLRVIAVGTTSAAQQFDIDMAQLEPSSTLPAYNPVRPSTDPSYSSSWVGAVSSSEATVAVHMTNHTTNQTSITYSTNSLFASGNTTTTALTPDAQGVTKHTITGLNADTTYYYKINSGPFEFTGGSFKTFPSAARSFTFGFGSCRQTGQDTPVMAHAKSNAEFFILSGDMHYEDIAVEDSGLRRSGYNDFLSRPNCLSFVRDRPMVYTWDDHDSCGNNAWSGSTGWTTAQAVYRERVPHYSIPGSSGVYQTFTFGPNVRFIVLDARSFRDAQGTTQSSSKTMLGATQKAWLINLLQTATERAIFIVSSVGWVGTEDSFDHWGYYTHERAEIAAYMDDRCVILSGDMHALGLDDGTNSVGGVPCWHGAPLRQTNSVKGGPYSHGTFSSEDNLYGLVEVVENGTTLTAKYNGVRAQSGTDWLEYTYTFPEATGTTDVSGSESNSLAISESASLSISVSGSDSGAITASESASQSITVIASDAAAVSIADISSTSVTLTRTETSAVSIAETQATAVSITGSDTSTLSISDSSARAGSSLSTDTGSIAIVETREQAVTSGAVDTSSVSISEQAAVEKRITSSDSSSISISEAFSSSLAATASDSGVISLAEQTSSFSQLAGTDSGPLSVSDSSQVTLKTIFIADSASITDSPFVSGVRTSSTDSSGSVDSFSAEVTADTNQLSASDSAGISITETSALFATKTGQDSGAWSVSETAGKNIDDSISTSDTSSIVITDTAGLVKSISGTEVIALAVGESSAVVKNVASAETHALSVTEAVVKNNNFSSSDGGAVSASEAKSIFRRITISDNSGSTDTGYSAGSAKRTTDNSGNTDSISTSTEVTGIIQRTISDNSGVTDSGASQGKKITSTDNSNNRDSLTTTKTTPSIEYVNISDNSGSGDSGLLEGFSIYSEATDVSGNTDAIVVKKYKSATDSSALAITESSNRSLSISRTDSAAITLSDSASVFKYVVKGSTDTAAVAVSESSTLPSLVTKSASDSAAISIASSTSGNNHPTSQQSTSIAISEAVNVLVSLTRSDSVAISVDTSRSIYSGTNAHEDRVYYQGQWRLFEIKIFIDGEWRDAEVKVYQGGNWT